MSKKRKHVIVKPEIHKKLKQKAVNDGISMEKITNDILKKGLRRSAKSGK